MLKVLYWSEIVQVEESLRCQVSIVLTLCLIVKLAIIKLQSLCKKVCWQILSKTHIIVETLKKKFLERWVNHIIKPNLYKSLFFLFSLNSLFFNYLFLLHFHITVFFLFSATFILFVLQTYFKLWFCKWFLFGNRFWNPHNSPPLVFRVTCLTPNQLGGDFPS